MEKDINMYDSSGRPLLVRFDWAMKRILRDKVNFGVLEGLLTSLLGRPIKIESILESESNQESADDKFNRVDLLARDSDGELMLIEVQNESRYSYFHRMLYGSSKLVTEYIKRGEGYENVKKVISINIVYFSLGEGSDYVYKGSTEFVGLHTGESLQLPGKWKERFNVGSVSDIFPTYYILRVNDFDKVSRTPLDQWMSFLKTGRIPNDADAPGLREARELLRVEELTDNEREAYYHHLDSDINTRDILETAIPRTYRGTCRGACRGACRRAFVGSQEPQGFGCGRDGHIAKHRPHHGGDLRPLGAAHYRFRRRATQKKEMSLPPKEVEKFTTLAALSRATGINQRQLSHYAIGTKQPRPASRERIIQGLHAIGRMALSLY